MTTQVLVRNDGQTQLHAEPIDPVSGERLPEPGIYLDTGGETAVVLHAARGLRVTEVLPEPTPPTE